LEELEAKIGLLVRNRISVQQIIAESSGLLRDIDKRASTDSSAHLKEKKVLYTDLLQLLLKEPRYLAQLCQLADPKFVFLLFLALNFHFIVDCVVYCLWTFIICGSDSFACWL
jgi:hypothetical protein